MAGNRELIKLVSCEKTGSCYYTDKNKKTMTTKLQKLKYDPFLMRRVMHIESKIK